MPARNTEVEGREGKQPDGSAKTREAKLAVVWSAQTPDKDGRPVRNPGSATYDGAPWIWNFANEHFPGATQIVDIFHAKGHLCEVAKAIYENASEIGERWARKRREELDEGRVGEVTAALRGHAGTCEEARKNAEYFSNNRARMNYPKCRAMGLCVATSVVEGGCKHIVGARLKQGGMR